MAEIAAQYPGVRVRTGKNGRQIITMPPDATRSVMRPAQSFGDGPDFEVVDVPIGGQEYQINTPGVSLRDVANGGGQTAYKVGNALNEAGKAGRIGPIGAMLGGIKGYLEADQKIGNLARRYGAGGPPD